MSRAIYRVTKDGNPAGITVHLGRMKKYVVPLSSPVPDLDALYDLSLETTLPMPDLEGSLSNVMIGAFTFESIGGHKRGVGAEPLTNFQYHLKLEGYPTLMGIWRHVNDIPQCTEMIASYRAAVLSTDSSAFKSPHAEISFCPRGCLIALSLGSSYIVLYCFQRFYFYHIKMSNH